jgi:hypothetical protein
VARLRIRWVLTEPVIIMPGFGYSEIDTSL